MQLLSRKHAETVVVARSHVGPRAACVTAFFVGVPRLLWTYSIAPNCMQPSEKGRFTAKRYPTATHLYEIDLVHRNRSTMRTLENLPASSYGSGSLPLKGSLVKKWVPNSPALFGASTPCFQPRITTLRYTNLPSMILQGKFPRTRQLFGV